MRKKNKKRDYGKNWYWNVSGENKQKLKKIWKRILKKSI